MFSKHCSSFWKNSIERQIVCCFFFLPGTKATTSTSYFFSSTLKEVAHALRAAFVAPYVATPGKGSLEQWLVTIINRVRCFLIVGINSRVILIVPMRFTSIWCTHCSSVCHSNSPNIIAAALLMKPRNAIEHSCQSKEMSSHVFHSNSILPEMLVHYFLNLFELQLFMIRVCFFDLWKIRDSLTVSIVIQILAYGRAKILHALANRQVQRMHENFWKFQ